VPVDTRWDQASLRQPRTASLCRHRSRLGTRAVTPSPVALRHRPGVRRAAWTLTTQGLSSASNFALTLLALASVPARTFALFSVCFTTYLLVVQAIRYVIGIPVLLDAHEPEERREGPEAASGLAAIAGLSVLPVLVAVAVLWPEVAPMMLVLAASMPLLLTQDALRHVAIAQGRAKAAALADGGWLAVQLVGSALLLTWGDGIEGSGRVAGLLALWGAGAALSSALLAVLLTLRPRLGRALAWLRANAAICRRVGVEFLVNSGSYYTLSYGLAALAGATELGYFRAAQTLFGPASVVLLGGAVLAVPESVRIRQTRKLMMRFAVRLSVALTVLSVVCGTMLVVALPVFGPTYLADSWRAIRAVVPWVTLFGAAIGAGAGALAALRALDASRWIVRSRAMASAAALVVGLPLGAWLGARGTLMALGAAEVVLAVRSWAQLRTLA
jgi:hypothetical protein